MTSGEGNAEKDSGWRAARHSATGFGFERLADELLVSIQGLWRLRQGVVSFLLLTAIPIALCGALLSYVVTQLN